MERRFKEQSHEKLELLSQQRKEQKRAMRRHQTRCADQSVDPKHMASTVRTDFFATISAESPACNKFKATVLSIDQTILTAETSIQSSSTAEHNSTLENIEVSIQSAASTSGISTEGNVQTNSHETREHRAVGHDEQMVDEGGEVPIQEQLQAGDVILPSRGHNGNAADHHSSHEEDSWTLDRHQLDDQHKPVDGEMQQRQHVETLRDATEATRATKATCETKVTYAIEAACRDIQHRIPRRDANAHHDEMQQRQHVETLGNAHHVLADEIRECAQRAVAELEAAVSYFLAAEADNEQGAAANESEAENSQTCTRDHITFDCGAAASAQASDAPGANIAGGVISCQELQSMMMPSLHHVCLIHIYVYTYPRTRIHTYM